MKKIFVLFLSFFLFPLICLAQTPSPTVSPKPAEYDENIIKINTSLIQIDVTVTDKEGKIVKDLKPEDFEVYENKEKQEITNFSFISSENQSSSTQKTVRKNDTPIPVSASPIRAEQVRRTIALVVDDLNTAIGSLSDVRRSLRKFVDEQMQPNDLVAILRTGVGIGVSQQFTNDKRLLYAAIDNIKCNSIGDKCFPQPPKLEGLAKPPAGISVSEVGLKSNESEGFEEDVITVGTLGGLSFIINGMKEMPGRKSIMFFSDGFSIAVAQRDRSSRVLDTLKILTESANRSSITIYSFDPRGLLTGMPEEVNGLLTRQQGLAYLAVETGGRAFLNRNDLSVGIEKALADQQGFYLIGYQPDPETFDPDKRRFNTLEIKVRRPDLTVRHRSGFFGVADTKAVDSPQSPAAQLLKAASSPFAANDIKLQLNTIFGNKEKEGSFVQSFLHVDAKELKFTDEPGGWKKAVFEILAISFGENGVPVDQISNTQTFRVKNELYNTIINKGFVYNFIFPVKKPGAYQMRVVLRDTATSKIGSAGLFIEVPNLKKEQLTLSGIILENLTQEQLQKSQTEPQKRQKTDPMTDTSLRRFKKGTVLRYGLDVYNAKLDSNRKPNLLTQMKVFRDGKILFEGKPTTLNSMSQTSSPKVSFAGALNLGQEIPAGEYVLQITVTDNLANTNRRLAMQQVQFEVTN